MMWRIPPVGWCAVCLAADDEENPAATIWVGTALCRTHLMSTMEEPREDRLG